MNDSWPIFFKTFQKLHNFMEEELKHLGLPEIEVYDVLWTLECAEDQSLRLNELGEKVIMAKFNTTRICKRLEESGLIMRVKCPEDKRGVYAKLTKKGKVLRAKIWKSYGKLIKDSFTDKLSASDHKALIQILSKLITNNNQV